MSTNEFCLCGPRSCATYNWGVNHIGRYLLNRLRAREGAFEIWEGQDTVTGTLVLVFKPVTVPPPAFRIQGALPWHDGEEDAWVAELPFGAVPLKSLTGKVSTVELTAWTRRLLGILLEMKASGLEHGRLDASRIWVKGEEVWIEGVGLPVEPKASDEAALVETLREVAGDRWRDWPFRRVLEELAAGGIGLREAAEYLADPRSLLELDSDDEGAERGPAGVLEERSGDAADAPTGHGREEVEATNVAIGEGSQLLEQAAEEAGSAEAGSVEHDVLEPDFWKNGGGGPDNEPGIERASRSTDPGRVIKINRLSEPTFDVIEPRTEDTRPRGRWVWRIGMLLFSALAILAAYWWSERQQPVSAGETYVVEFRVDPPDGHAELVLLDAPEGSGLVRDRVLAEIPGKVSFDIPGVYRIQIRAEGFLPQEKLIEVPPRARSITVRLGP